MGFCCCLRIMCQMSIVNSYVLEFVYVISFLGFLCSILLHGFWVFLPLLCVVLADFCLCLLIWFCIVDDLLTWFSMSFENCVSIPLLLILFVISGLTFHPILSALSLLGFQFMNFHQTHCRPPALFVYNSGCEVVSV